MGTSETERVERPNESPTAPATQAGPAETRVIDPPAPAAAAAPEISAPEPAAEPVALHDPADRLRAEFAEIATIAAQAARLGVTVDAADAMRRGISADALRRSVLDALAARTEATSVIAAAPPTTATVDSPIVRLARRHAAEARG